MKYLDDDRDIRFNLFEWLDLDPLLKSGPYVYPWEWCRGIWPMR